MGVSTRDMTDDLAGIDSQALDISFLVTYAEKLPDTGSSKVAVVSFSWGGYRAYLRRRGTFASGSWLKWTAAYAITQDSWQKLEPFTRSNWTVPLLFFTSNNANFIEEWEHSDAAPSDKIRPHVLNEWTHADVMTVNVTSVPSCALLAPTPSI